MRDSEPENPRNYKNQGDDYFNNGKYAMAIRCYIKALKIDPLYSEAWNNLGYSFHKLGKEDAAERCKKRRVELELIREEKKTHFPTIQQEDSISISDEKATLISVPIEENISISENMNNEILDNTRSQSPQDTTPIIVNGNKETDIKQQQAFPQISHQKESLQNTIYSDTIEREVKQNNGIFLSETNNEQIKTTKKKSFITGFKTHEIDVGVELNEKIWENSDDIKKVLAVSLILGICLCFFLVVFMSHTERYTQFYFIPDSYSNIMDTSSNVTSFSYGVKSAERDVTEYTLSVFVNSGLIQENKFSLQPGEIKEERVSFSIEGFDLNSSNKIEAFLKSPHSSYDLHYWINV